MTLNVGSTLGAYEILSVLGTGGMGEVYRARDSRLQRDVAVKVLPAHIVDDPGLRRRFEREARAVAALNHPHIITIHDIGECFGTLFIAFELIDGDTLQKKLSRGRLPVVQAAAFAVQIIDGLAHAHDAGVIHRDLKPGNLMITSEGRVKILDFGLGKFIRSAPTLAATNESQTVSVAGIMLGTVGYMSPEQVTGGDVDARSDQFAFGAVLYEMLTGSRAFQRETPIQTLSAIVDDDPSPLAAVAPHVPYPVTKVVYRCLAKRPQDRYNSTRELLSSLREIAIDLEHPSEIQLWRRPWLLATAAGALVVAAVLGGIEVGRIPVPRSEVQVSAPAILMLSILPIETETADTSTQAYWAGMTREITTRLAALPSGGQLHVTPAVDVSARQVRTARDARLELGATHVLRARAIQDGAQTRARLELVDTLSGKTIRTGDVSANSEERSSLQNRLLDTILTFIDVTIPKSDRTRLTASTAAAGVHDFYLQGLGYLQDDSKFENVDTAIEVFQHALSIDPKYAPAFAGLGEAYWKKYLGNREVRWAETARATCERALGLDEQDAAPHRCLGTIASGVGEFEKSVEEFQHALAREPDSEVAYIGLASAYDGLGLPKRAEETYLRAISLRPRYWNGYSRLGGFYYTQRRYAEAERMFREVIALNPDSWRGYSNLGALYYVQGRTADAVASYQRSLAIRPNYQAASNLGTLYFFDLNQYPQAVQAFQQAATLDSGQYVVWGNLASALYWDGKPNEALSAFARASELAKRRLTINPNDAAVTMSLAGYEAAAGRRDQARALMNKALALVPGDARLMFQAGVLHEYWFGDREKGLEWLGRALSAGYQWKEVEHSPALAALRNDARIDELRRRGKSPAER